MKGYSGATNTNPVKDSTRLLDLITEVQNVSIEIRQFMTIYIKNIGDTSCKNSGLMMEFLDFIYKEGF